MAYDLLYTFLSQHIHIITFRSTMFRDSFIPYKTVCGNYVFNRDAKLFKYKYNINLIFKVQQTIHTNVCCVAFP